MATGAQIITKFQNMVDDVIDSDLAYQLLNDAKDEIEAMTIWEILKKDQTYAVTGGYSYTAALGALPTRFALDVRMVEANANTPYDKVGFDDLIEKQNNPLGYFFDLNAGNLYLSGSNHSAKTMHFYHTAYSADLTSSGTWVFPSRFHRALPIKMAELYYAIDAGEKARAWDDRWMIQFDKVLAQMELWNDSLKVRNRVSFKRASGNTPKSIRR